MKLIVIHFTGAEIPTSDARALHLHNRGEWLAKGAFTAVGLLNGDDEVATVAGRTDVADFKGAGGTVDS